jgi:hypothetical protein
MKALYLIAEGEATSEQESKAKDGDLFSAERNQLKVESPTGLNEKNGWFQFDLYWLALIRPPTGNRWISLKNRFCCRAKRILANGKPSVSKNGFPRFWRFVHLIPQC